MTLHSQCATSDTDTGLGSLPIVSLPWARAGGVETLQAFRLNLNPARGLDLRIHRIRSRRQLLSPVVEPSSTIGAGPINIADR